MDHISQYSASKYVHILATVHKRMTANGASGGAGGL